MALFKSTYTRAQIDEAIGRALNIVAEGKIYNNRGAWVSEGSYSNTSEIIDVVVYDGVSYFCLVTHSGQSTAPSADTTRWALLHAYETFIKNAATDSIADDDTIPFTDISDSARTKKTTWSVIKSALGELFTAGKLKLAGYIKPAEKAVIAETDTINQAIGKLEAGVDAHGSALSDHADMLDEHGQAIEAHSTQINDLSDLSTMSFKITDVDNNVTYNWGMQIKDGKTQIMYEEVV